MSRTVIRPHPRALRALVLLGVALALVGAAALDSASAAPALAAPAHASTTARVVPVSVDPTTLARGAARALQQACCSHPPPPRTRGVPYRWCVRHHTCWEARAFVHRHVDRFRHRTKDTLTHRTLPRRFERILRRKFHGGGCSACVRTAESARRDGGGYDDWVEASDCVQHGYGCYPTANPRPELSRVEKTFLWCAGTVAIARVPGLSRLISLGNSAQSCFWGATYYWGKFWR